MTILDFFNAVEETLTNLKNDYTVLSDEVKEDINTRFEELSTDLQETFLSRDNIVAVINELGNEITVGKSLDSEKAYGLTIDELKQIIIPTNDIVDFKLIENGTAIRYSYDSIDSVATDAGFELFCPHNKYEFDLARKYLLALGKNGLMGPLGIYYDGSDIPLAACNGCWCSNIPLNSDHMGKKGWKVKDGSTVWWASDRTDVTEPSGDYVKYAYLGIWYDENGFVRWYNDRKDSYVYTSYLTVKRSS